MSKESIEILDHPIGESVGITLKDLYPAGKGSDEGIIVYWGNPEYEKLVREMMDKAALITQPLPNKSEKDEKN